LFRQGKRRDPLLVLAIVVYLASILWIAVLPSFIE
jgi:hypothetical protein